MRQRVIGIGRQRASVIILGFPELAQAVADGAQVDQCAGGLGIVFDGLQIRLHGLLDGCAGFFQKKALLKPGFGIALAGRRGRLWGKGLYAG